MSYHRFGFQTNQYFKTENFQRSQNTLRFFFFCTFGFLSICAKAMNWQTAAMTNRFLLHKAKSNIFPVFFLAEDSPLAHQNRMMMMLTLNNEASLLKGTKKKSLCESLALLFRIDCQRLHSSLRDPVSWGKCVLSVTCLTLICPLRNVPILGGVKGGVTTGEMKDTWVSALQRPTNHLSKLPGGQDILK